MGQRGFSKILINLIFLIIIFLCFEYISYSLFLKKIDYKPNFVGGYNCEKSIPTWAEIRETKHLDDNKKRPILFFGGSYTYGFHLKDEETFSATVEKLTGRNCYNFGMIGYNISEELLLIDSKKFKDKLLTISKPEYIVYTYMFDHINRNDYWNLFDSFRIRGLIPDQKYNFLYKLWSVQYIQSARLAKKYFSNLDTAGNIDFYFKILAVVKSECDKMFPDSKFVVLIYSDVNKDLSKGLYDKYEAVNNDLDKTFQLLNSSEFRKRFEKMGITVVSTEELLGRKMDRVEDRVANDENRPHPSYSAWQQIAPEFVKTFNL